MIDTDNNMTNDTGSSKAKTGKAMKIALIAVSSLALASGAALAAKPENAGRDKAKEKAGQYLKEEKVDRFSDKSGYGRGDDSSDDRSDDESDDRSDDKSDDRSDDKSDDRSDDKSDDRSDDKSDDRSDDKSDDRSDDRSSDKKEKKEKKGKRESMMEEHVGMDRDGYDGDKRGLEKQRDMKMDQERKESGKGSEKGQEMREENSKKWWKFWGEPEAPVEGVN